MKFKYYFASCIVFIIFISSYNLFAQILDSEYNLDSLIIVNNKYLKQDEKKLELLNIISYSYQSKNPAKGVEFADMAIALSQKIKSDKGLATALNNKAINLNPRTYLQQCDSLFQLAIVINEKINNQYALADNLNNRGKIFTMKGDTTESLKFYRRALAVNEKLNYKKGIAKSLKGIGNVYFSKNIFVMALEYYIKLLKINEQLGNKQDIANTLGGLGYVYRELSDNTKALEYLNKSAAINEQIGNKPALANDYNNIGKVYMNLLDYSNTLKYFQKALETNEQTGNKKGIADSYSNIAQIYNSLSDYPVSLENFQKALTINEQIGNKIGVSANLNGIGNVYNHLSNFPKAIEFYNKSFNISKEVDNKEFMILSLGNLGTVYSFMSEYPKALESFNNVLNLQEQLGLKNKIQITYTNIANAYSRMTDSSALILGLTPTDKYNKALENYQKSISISMKLGDSTNQAHNYIALGDLYYILPDSILIKEGINPSERFKKFLEYKFQGLKIAKEIGELNIQKDLWKGLSSAYENQGDFAKAYDAYKSYVILRDSIFSNDKQKEINRLQMQFDFDKKEVAYKYDKQLSDEKLLRQQKEISLKQQALEISNKEKDLQHLSYLKEKAEKQEKEKQLSLSEKEKQLQLAELHTMTKEKELQQSELELTQAEVKSKNLQRNAFITGSVLLLLLAGAIFIGLRKTAKEKKKSEDLLLNILPAEVAEELKAKGSAEAKLIDEVTVLFTDFKGFTQMSEKLSAKDLVSEINECFSEFDNIMQKHSIEKIKTIGDSYMAAGGLPTPNSTHALDVVNASMEIQKFMNHQKTKKEAAGQLYFEIRIGVHTGPVVAGIVGIKKYSYDIWGDTVNTASRMESSGEIGQINISGTTYELVKDNFNCIHRGKIEAKGKGEIDMYFVDNFRTPA
jgi:class 3 adenylate cyclase/tetratricopeptide (TPR) repeat protein